MLISRRKEGETLLIGHDIEVRIVSVHKNKVILGIIAPANVKIATSKMAEVEMANTMAAANSANIDRFLHTPVREAERVLHVLMPNSATSSESDR